MITIAQQYVANRRRRSLMLDAPKNSPPKWAGYRTVIWTLVVVTSPVTHVTEALYSPNIG